MFNVTTTATGVVTQARLPNDTRSFIDRMAIYMGGVLVQNSFSNYNPPPRRLNRDIVIPAEALLGAARWVLVVCDRWLEDNCTGSSP